ncbi:MAG: hypothetical protein LBF44_02440 [Holosporaceae bacterium]|jgi:hypothetical protein|nr:hypothetical protein [Holosporaceae bacterium]
MYDNLDALIKDLEIVSLETKTAPTSNKERCVIKIQLLAAQIIEDDMDKIQKISPHLSKEKIMDQLLDNWTANIKDFISAMAKSHTH